MALRNFIKQWLMHFFTVWLVINVFTTTVHFYEHNIWHSVGSQYHITPAAVTRFLIDHNLNSPDFLYLMAVILLAEFSYHYLFRKRSLPAFIIYSIIAGLLLTLILAVVRGMSLGQYLGTYLLFSLWFIAYTIVYSLIRGYFYQRVHHVQVQLSLSEAELQGLKQQVNPHFLFNTLNYLFGTALQENAPNTASGIDLMADMMRYALTGTQQKFVPFKDEIQFIENYLQLQKLRLPLDKVHTLETTITTDNKPYHIAPMLLLPFIENAFKYGISTDEPSYIKIKIEAVDNKLNMDIDNSITPGINTIKGTKSGLSITRKQLELLYPEKHTLKINTGETSYHVRLCLTLNK